MAAFPDLLEAAMLARGFTLAEVARRLGVHLTFIDKLIRGEVPPPFDRMEALAIALDLTGEARERFIDAAMLARLDPVMMAWIERRIGRVPALPMVTELGLPTSNPPVPRLGRPRGRRGTRTGTRRQT